MPQLDISNEDRNNNPPPPPARSLVGKESTLSLPLACRASGVSPNDNSLYSTPYSHAYTTYHCWRVRSNDLDCETLLRHADHVRALKEKTEKEKRNHTLTILHLQENYLTENRLARADLLEEREALYKLTHDGTHHHPSDCLRSMTAPHSRMSMVGGGDCGGSTVGSTCSEGRHDSQLDLRLMKTINDVKFKNRPKYVVFSDVNFQRECIDTHNEVRQRHACPPLEWSQNLADLATTWAEKLVDRGRLLYPEIPGVGENIFLSSCSEQTHLTSGQEITHKWAAEGMLFSFDNPRWNTASQHFTQIVWRETTEMGASRCWLPLLNKCAIVVLYRPAGNSNIAGDFQLNVPPPLSPTDADVELDACPELRGAFGGDLRVSSPAPPPSRIESEPPEHDDRQHKKSTTPANKKTHWRLWSNFRRRCSGAQRTKGPTVNGQRSHSSDGARPTP